MFDANTLEDGRSSPHGVARSGGLVDHVDLGAVRPPWALPPHDAAIGHQFSSKVEERLLHAPESESAFMASVSSLLG